MKQSDNTFPMKDFCCVNLQTIVGTIFVVSGHMDTHGVICPICICACAYVVVRLCVIVLLLLLVPNDLTTLATRMATAPPISTFNS